MITLKNNKDNNEKIKVKEVKVNKIRVRYVTKRNKISFNFFFKI